MNRIDLKFKEMLLKCLASYRVIGSGDFEHPRWYQLLSKPIAREYLKELGFEPSFNKESYTFYFRSSQCRAFFYFSLENLTDEELAFTRDYESMYKHFRELKYKILLAADVMDSNDSVKTRLLKNFGDSMN